MTRNDYRAVISTIRPGEEGGRWGAVVTLSDRGVPLASENGYGDSEGEAIYDAVTKCLAVRSGGRRYG